MEEFSPPIRSLKSSTPTHESVSYHNSMFYYAVVPIAILTSVILIYLGVMWLRSESKLNREIIEHFFEKEHQLAQERSERFFEKLETKLFTVPIQTKTQLPTLTTYLPKQTNT